MKSEYLDIYCLKTELWISRMKNLEMKISPLWQMNDLDKALKSLKNNKTMDPHGIINEVFKEGCVGRDLKEALLLLFNGVKSNLFIPKFMTFENISTIYKNKGSRLQLDNDRGIFILTVLKKILDKLTYHDKYDDIDIHMSDSKIGARKNKNIRNHLFMIYGIMNSVIKGKNESIDIHIYDLVKAFDALWLEDTLNNVYDTISDDERDDKLALLYRSNEVNLVAVKTAVGLTKRVNVPAIVQQGGTWGPMLCSNSIDTIGKKCRDRGEHFYLYKNTVRVLPFAMVDDCLGISRCGDESVALWRCH